MPREATPNPRRQAMLGLKAVTMMAIKRSWGHTCDVLCGLYLALLTLAAIKITNWAATLLFPESDRFAEGLVLSAHSIAIVSFVVVLSLLLLSEIRKNWVKQFRAVPVRQHRQTEEPNDE